MLDVRFRIWKASFDDRTYECWYAIVDASIQTMSNEKNDEGTILAQVMKFLFEKNNFRSTWLWPEFGVQFLDDSWLQRIFSESGSSYASMISRKMGLILKYKWNHCKHNQTKSFKKYRKCWCESSYLNAAMTEYWIVSWSVTSWTAFSTMKSP